MDEAADDAMAAKEHLRTLAQAMGAKVFGVADLDELKRNYPALLSRVLGDYSRAAVFGVRLQRAVLEAIADGPTPLYFHHYRQANYQLDRIALAAADLLQDRGFRALAIPASQIVASQPMSGHVSHKLLGWAAGLGFIGRSTLLVNPVYGAQMRYVSVLTDAPLPPDTPRSNGCGTCRACVAACPAAAIADESGAFDLDACYRKLTEFSRLPFVGQHICGVCVKACAGSA
jgi:epoxyqueuosine reductase QueG